MSFAKKLLLVNGIVIDPSRNFHGPLDILIEDGRLTGLEPGLESIQAESIDISEMIATPGLIDFHVHVYWGVSPLSVHPDRAGPETGVTTVVDAGSAGAGNFPGFLKYVIEATNFRIRCFLNIGFAGWFGSMRAPRSLFSASVGDLCDIRLANVEAAVQVGQEYSEYIKGIKIRAGSCGYPGLEPIFTARRAAEELNVPLMVHIGLPPPTIETILPILRPGDILTHIYRGNPNSMLDGRGSVIPEAWRAKERGVHFDLGHGQAAFSFDTAKRMIDQGFLPDIISTDLHQGSINGPVFNLAATMTKMLHLGMALDDVIRAVTSAPAQAIGLDNEIGCLKIGGAADVSVLKMIPGDYELWDSHGQKMTANIRISPFMTIRAGQIAYTSDA